MSLKSILQRYTNVVQLGEGDEPDFNQLKADLEAVRTRNSAFVWLYVGMVVVAFAAFIGYAHANQSDSARLNVATTVFGGSATSVIALLLNVWREKTRTETLLALAVGLKDETILREVMRGLLRNLYSVTTQNESRPRLRR